jgi:hypothetical protein
VLGEAQAGDRFQFERIGYFYAEPDSRPGAPGVKPHRHAEGFLEAGVNLQADGTLP